jgi:hypothetical protein
LDKSKPALLRVLTGWRNTTNWFVSKNNWAIQFIFRDWSFDLKTQKRICKKSDCDGRSFFVFGGVEIALIVLTAVNVYPLFNGCTVEAVCAEFYTGDILIKCSSNV